MKKNKIRMKQGIFQKLIISYVVFAVLITISFMICLIIASLMITDGNPAALSPYEVVDDEGNVTNLEAVTNLDGWIEELDENYNVVKVYGEKRTEQTHYTIEDIYNITSMRMAEDANYIGFIKPISNQNRYFLMIYGTDVMQVERTVVLNASSNSTGKLTLFIFLIFGVMFLANSILLSLYLRRKIKRPLDRLITGMEQVREGKTNVSLDFKTEAEFEKIRDAFNSMAWQLEQEKSEKQEMVRKKNQLILELSHDIKTPTATIKSYANALEAGMVPPEKMQDYYHTIDMKANRIVQLSEDMFTLLKMDNADYTLQMEKTNLSELVRQICAEHYEEITDAGFEFDIEIPEQSCMAMLDVRMFTRVVSNLLDNARKYNHTGNYIGLQLQYAEQGWQLDVSDDGAALEEELVKNLFDAFVRGDKARKSDGGTGLGLAISKAIVEKHDGKIMYQRVDEKNCFRVWLPCMKI